MALPKHDFYTGSDYLEGERIEVGPKNIELLQLSRIHEAEQYRRGYDQDGIESLARSMVKDEAQLNKSVELEDYGMITESLDIGTPLIVNRLDAVHLEEFLAQHAEHYQIEVESILFEPGMETVDVLASGHRRKRALLLLAKQYGFDPERIYVEATVHENLSFEETLGKQFRENVSQPPPQIDAAESIARYYNQKVRAGERPTHESVAQFYCVKVGVVSSALAFSSLPDHVKEFVKKEFLPFSLVASFQGLAKAYAGLWEREQRGGDAVQKAKYIEDSLVVTAHSLSESRYDGAKIEYLKTVLKERIKAVNEKSTDTTQGELFLIQEAPPKQRRINVTDKAARHAISMLQLLQQQGDLSDQRMAEIQELTDRARRVAEELEETEFPLF